MPSHVLMSVNVGQLKPGDIWMSEVNNYDVLEVSENHEDPALVDVTLRFEDRPLSAGFTVTYKKTKAIRAYVAYQAS